MKICAAQTKPITGDIQMNIEKHLQYIDRSATSGADAIIFPELSLTGYEPTLAKKLATNADDHRLDVFQVISDGIGITIGVGLPTLNGDGLSISMVLFQPNKPRLTYSKKYLHPDEEKFFIPGQNFPSLSINDTAVGIAICYELSIPDHSKAAADSGARIYVASVAKFAKGVADASKTLLDIAKNYSMTTIMVNAVGPADNGMCAGNSSVWNDNGELSAQLSDTMEGILIYNTTSGEVVQKKI